jgi:DNA polymerase IV
LGLPHRLVVQSLRVIIIAGTIKVTKIFIGKGDVMKSMYPRNGRVILHVDCNAFFASCEIAHDPTLEGEPVVVVGNLKRNGLVLAANYIARDFGIYTTMALWEAKKKCPELVVKEPNFGLYREISAKIFEYLTEITPMVEPASIDEAYMDITGCWELGSPLEIAEQIQKDIYESFKIPTSLGISTCKVLSKIASDMKKPLGITVLRRRDIPDLLWPKPVQEMWGCGPKTAEKLNSIGIMTIGDLAKAEEKQLTDVIGKNGMTLKNWANGIDSRPVNRDAAFEFKSVGNSTTLAKNTSEERILIEVLKKLAGSVSSRMIAKKVVSKTIQLTIRYSDFKTITRSQTLPNPIKETADILHTAVELFRKNWNGDHVRLLGISALNVVDQREATKQLDLFHYESEALEVEKKEPLHKTVEKLRQKFGENIIQTGADLAGKQAKREKA